MYLINPSFSFRHDVNGEAILKSIEDAGRTCYKTEDKIKPGTARPFVEKLVHGLKHESVIEHENISVRIICDRGVTHEIVRHRLASYSQESTRYCNYTKNAHMQFVRPAHLVGKVRTGLWDFNMVDMEDGLTPEYVSWLRYLLVAEQTYNQLSNMGWSPQEARSVLPNCLKTEIVMTCNLREWRHFFRMRADKAAHPDMQIIAVEMLTQFHQKVPIIFDDLYETCSSLFIVK